jgi:hypothetical protein
MTTTVTVKARAHGAVVETNGETIQVSPGQERQFHIEEGTQSFSVTQPAEAPADRAAELADEEVPGRAQNDELLGPRIAGNRRPAKATRRPRRPTQLPAAVVNWKRGRVADIPARPLDLGVHHEEPYPQVSHNRKAAPAVAAG